MSYFAVTREAGPAWTAGKGVLEQPALSDHATFMNALADRRFLLFGGPLAGTEHGRVRALLIRHDVEQVRPDGARCSG